MPSSSKHETSQELRLAYWYKRTYAYLHYSRLYKQASAITSVYAELLECEKKDLLHTLRSDQKWWDQMGNYCKGKSTSDNVWAAADCLSDTAACLNEFGRREEANKYCEWAEELKDLAIEYYEREQEDERKRKAYGY